MSDRWIDTLPPHLTERICSGGEGDLAPEGDLVVYWMRGALRAHENPALDVALLLAERAGVPLLVYHGLSERTPFANDRIHTFILEGARDVRDQLAARSISHVFHLERAGHRGPHLRDLHGRSRALVTEHWPVPPLRAWTDALRGSDRPPVITVDTSCIVPMTFTREAPERAFAFRKKTERAREERIGRPWPEVDDPAPTSICNLTFEPTDLDQDLEELVASCRIDHGVAPVPGTPGGTRAGIARWERFRDGPLARYASRRNDPLATDGVSRLSPYLHFGMVSPFLVAREAQERGAEKWLDELLVWRELAHHWCHHTEDPESLASLPAWARETLLEGAADQRTVLHDMDTLARGRTDEPLWDACQRSLLIHGELHNNVRMTWGKALLGWTAGPAEALDALITLNHRYALDGRDPSSYGGLLWCLGLFDRPFDPPSEVLGDVRGRSLAGHARRLDVNAYARLTARPAIDAAPRVAVIGAGIAGLACSRTLVDHGVAVTAFERSGRPGGRVATTKLEDDLLDHGAQIVPARSPRFVEQLEAFVARDLLTSWQPRRARLTPGGTLEDLPTHTLLIGQPTMNAWPTALAEDLPVRTRTNVERLERIGDEWLLRDDEGEDLGRFDAVVLAVPAPQVIRLLGGHEGPVVEAARRARYDPGFVAVVRVQDEGFAHDAIEGAGQPLAWAARAASRRMDLRPPADGTWILHAGGAWSRDRLGDEELEALRGGTTPPRTPEVSERHHAMGMELGTAFARLIDPAAPAFELLKVHRWGLSLVSEPAFEDGPSAAAEPGKRLYAAGDWCVGDRIESAWSSGVAAAGRLLGNAARRSGPPSEERQGSLFG